MGTRGERRLVASLVVLAVAIGLVTPAAASVDLSRSEPNAVVAATPGSSVAAEAATAKPNFVVIITDDQKWDSVGRCKPELDPFDFNAGTDACMPNLQNLLMHSGTTYLKGQVTQSLCCPSRASLLTGQYSTTHGVTNNNGSLFNDSSTLATWLDTAGYRTALFGKYLNGYGLGNLYGYKPPGWDAFESFHGYRNSDEPYTNYPWISFAEGSSTGVITQVLDANSTSGAACAAGNYYSTDYICKLTLDFLRANTTTPFLAYVNPATPHSPYTVAARHVGAFSGINIPYYPDTNVLPAPNPPSYLPLQNLTPRNLDRIEATGRNILAQTLTVDDMIGALHDQLVSDGRLANTVWVFISDNGIASGEHHWQNKGCEYYMCHQVPFIFVCPTGVCAGAQPGSVDPSHYVLNIDIAPTIAALAGATPTIAVDGMSMVPILNNMQAPWRTQWFVHGNDPQYEGIVGIATDGHWYKYIDFTATGERELYNVDTDPWELTNLAGNSSYVALQADLAARLATHLSGGPPPNSPPTASFSSSCTLLACAFTDSSSDSDGTVVAWSWTFGDGSVSTLKSPSHTYASAGTYTVGLTVTDDKGAVGTTSKSVTVTNPTSGGQVVFEAESYTTLINRGNDTWALITTPTGFSGTGAMQPGPDTGDTVRSSPATTAPELTYSLNFTTTGTYYVWVRAWAPDARGKAMFVALDTGAATGISAGGGASRNAGVGVWSWSNTQRTAAVTVTASTTGVHTFHLWMGDDGVIIDKIVLTTDPSYVPTDLGPPVSGVSGLQSTMA